VYTGLRLVFGSLGLVGVLVASKGNIRLVHSGAYDGRFIMKANVYFICLALILGIELISWFVCAAYDHRIHVRSKPGKEK